MPLFCDAKVRWIKSSTVRPILVNVVGLFHCKSVREGWRIRPAHQMDPLAIFLIGGRIIALPLVKVSSLIEMSNMHYLKRMCSRKPTMKGGEKMNRKYVQARKRLCFRSKWRSIRLIILVSPSVRFAVKALKAFTHTSKRKIRLVMAKTL